MNRLSLASLIVATMAPPVSTESTDNDHLFTVGEIEVPHGGEPGEVSMVSGNVIDPGHLLLIVRNNRDVPVYDISIVLTGTDSAGEAVTAELFVPTAGLAPGDWIFASNAVETAGLDDLADGQLRFDASERRGPFDASERRGPFVALEVTSAELRGDVVVGTVTNSGNVAVGRINAVSVACFDESQPTAFTGALLDVQRLDSGDSVDFTTEPLDDPTTCTALAVYAVGVPEADLR